MREPVADPIALFQQLFAEAEPLEPFDATRCVVATADATGRPSVRFVLLKHVDSRGFGFFTNYESRKARDLAANPFAALAIHFSSTGVQVRVEGPTAQMSPAESDAYFLSRPRGSQIGAWASPQSRTLDAREDLEARVAELEARFGDGPIPRPPHWGGYRIAPERIEFWWNRESRLHDRLLYERTGEKFHVTRLAP